MKLHKALVEAIPELVKFILEQECPADIALRMQFKKHSQWGKRDRHFVATAVYDLIRYHRFYTELTKSKSNYWLHTSAWIYFRYNMELTWPNFPKINPYQLKALEEELKLQPQIYESYPDWMWSHGMEMLGSDRWYKEASSLNREAPVYLRVNILKAPLQKVLLALQEEGIEASVTPGPSETLRLHKRAALFKTKAFNLGWFEVQDFASQHIVPFSGVQPGQTVIDVCAGAGGKTLHFAAVMQNTGQIFAADPAEKKIMELKKRAKRAGAQNIQCILLNTESVTLEKLKAKADVVLMDVPCSGSGVFKRHPESKWTLTAEALTALKQIQNNILHTHCSLVRSGGTLVYSTCSIFPDENELQVQEFLKTHSEFILEAEQMLYPSGEGDGFYMARLKRQ